MQRANASSPSSTGASTPHTPGTPIGDGHSGKRRRLSPETPGSQQDRSTLNSGPFSAKSKETPGSAENGAETPWVLDLPQSIPEWQDETEDSPETAPIGRRQYGRAKKVKKAEQNSSTSTSTFKDTTSSPLPTGTYGNDRSYQSSSHTPTGSNRKRRRQENEELDQIRYSGISASARR